MPSSESATSGGISCSQLALLAARSFEDNVQLFDNPRPILGQLLREELSNKPGDQSLLSTKYRELFNNYFL
jgi:hypothetical protein